MGSPPTTDAAHLGLPNRVPRSTQSPRTGFSAPQAPTGSAVASIMSRTQVPPPAAGRCRRAEDASAVGARNPAGRSAGLHERIQLRWRWLRPGCRNRPMSHSGVVPANPGRTAGWRYCGGPVACTRGVARIPLQDPTRLGDDACRSLVPKGIGNPYFPRAGTRLRRPAGHP